MLTLAKYKLEKNISGTKTTGVSRLINASFFMHTNSKIVLIHTLTLAKPVANSLAKTLAHTTQNYDQVRTYL